MGIRGDFNIFIIGIFREDFCIFIISTFRTEYLPKKRRIVRQISLTVRRVSLFPGTSQFFSAFAFAKHSITGIRTNATIPQVNPPL